VHLGSGQRFRQVLVVTQFTLTVILVAATIVIHRQLNYMQEKDLGFDQDALVYLRIGDMDKKDKLRLRDELRDLQSVHSASLASNSLIDNVNSTSYFDYEGKLEGAGFLITRINTDASYIGTMGMKLIEGRNFDARASDSAAYIVNRTAAKRMGWSPEEALGKTFNLHDVPGPIIGVLEDFHFRPMTAAIEPAVLSYQMYGWYSGILIKVANARSITDIESVYKKYEPLTPAHYNFVDEQLDSQYKLQQTTGTLVMFFSGLAIFVACLGLYGLAAFIAERRTKEIGIRKVLGASVENVSLMLSRDFVSLVIVSVVIACPLAYQLMSTWLQSFVYRVDLSWTFFAFAGLLALSIAAITVLYQAIVAARMNPVNSLRSE
jgi:ABC-type antimicrobial peptide transport system permease subunit